MGYRDKEPSLEERQLIGDHPCNAHEHKLGWLPVDQLGPQVGHSFWREQIGGAGLDLETSAKMA